jgi:hypothetical protein
LHKFESENFLFTLYYDVEPPGTHAVWPEFTVLLLKDMQLGPSLQCMETRLLLPCYLSFSVLCCQAAAISPQEVTNLFNAFLCNTVQNPKESDKKVISYPLTWFY